MSSPVLKLLSFVLRRPACPGLVGSGRSFWWFACALVLLPGCASVVPGAGQSMVLGENAAYQVFNASRARLIEMPSLQDARTGAQLYANLRAASLRSPAPVLAAPARTSARFNDDPGDEKITLPRSPVNMYAAAGPAHRVPDHVVVRWRLPPRAGQHSYRGDKVKPVRIALRSKIPRDVLAMVRNQWRLRLDIAIAATEQSAVVRWRLLNDKSLEVRRGGDW